MGGRSSKSNVPKKSLYAGGPIDHFGSSGAEDQWNELQPNKPANSTHPQARKSMEKQPQEPNQLKESNSFRDTSTTGYESSEDEFYDGIPRYQRTLSQKSRLSRSKQATGARVSETSSRLGRAGTAGLGKAVAVLDTLGSSMTNLNSSSGFASGVATKGNKLSILSFEVANTIVKGSSIMQSLSKRSIRQLKEVVLLSENVQHLVSKDMNELLRIVAADKREELRIFAGEVVRFGNRCKDSQWHNLDRYFEKHGRQLSPLKQLKEEAESVMQQLMTLVQYTAELYQELHALDRFEQDYLRKRLVEDNPFAAQRGDSLTTKRADLKSQRKQVRSLKKKSLWSKSLEEVMEKLADIVIFLNREIHNAFDIAGDDKDKPLIGPPNNQQRLGPLGLDLHYANIIIQIDTIVARSSSVPPNSRETLYQNLPPSIKASLRSKVQTFHVNKELTVTEIKAEMEKTLSWLVPTATNTAKAHHGFGWVGEWASTGSELNRRQTGTGDAIQIETLHHAEKEKTEAYMLELLLWLNHLVIQSRAANGRNGTKLSIKSPISSALPGPTQLPEPEVASATSSSVSVEEQKTETIITQESGTLNPQKAG